VSEKVEEKELDEEVVIGEQLQKEYRTKVKFKDSAELRMIIYIVPAAIIMILIAVVLSKINY
jgi:hypothetical protein